MKASMHVAMDVVLSRSGMYPNNFHYVIMAA